MNRLNKEKTSKKSIKMSENKSMIYLGNMMANYYNDLEDKYESDIDIRQVNFNAFYCPYDKKVEKLEYKFYDMEKGITKSNVSTVDLYLISYNSNRLSYNHQSLYGKHRLFYHLYQDLILLLLP